MELELIEYDSIKLQRMSEHMPSQIEVLAMAIRLSAKGSF